MIAQANSLAGGAKCKISVALLWLTFGPYHVARAKALAQQSDLECYFIELTGRDGMHSWIPAAPEDGFRLLTLSRHGLPSRLAAPMVTRELNRLNPDVVVSCGYGLKEMRVAARWAGSHSKGSILTFETTRHDRSRYRAKEWLKSFIVKRYYDAGFVGGTLHRAYLEQLGIPPGRISGPYDVVDNGYFERKVTKTRASAEWERRQLGLPARYFFYVGRYAVEKNLERLLRAYGIYRARNPQGWALVLVGDGPEKHRLYRLASSLSLRDVVWTGFKQIDELPAYYALASCFVLPSTSEPWGLVVNEAMASGLPVLVSDRCGCAPELVRNGENGFLFNPYDVEGIATALEQISCLEEEHLRKMTTISRSIVSGYTPEVWAKNLGECIRTAVKTEPTFH